jgi:hypothetical protein
MNHNLPAAPGATPKTALTACAKAKSDFLNELGRIYLDAGLPLAAAFEAALADVLFFDVCPSEG